MGVNSSLYKILRPGRGGESQKETDTRMRLRANRVGE